METKKRSLNLEIIVSNLAEAAEELEKLRARASNGELDEANLQVGLLHAYHHLNFAWNIRHISTSQYTKLTQEQFNHWSKYPLEIENL